MDKQLLTVSSGQLFCPALATVQASWLCETNYLFPDGRRAVGCNLLAVIGVAANEGRWTSLIPGVQNLRIRGEMILAVRMHHFYSMVSPDPQDVFLWNLVKISDVDAGRDYVSQQLLKIGVAIGKRHGIPFAPPMTASFDLTVTPIEEVIAVGGAFEELVVMTPEALHTNVVGEA